MWVPNTRAGAQLFADTKRAELERMAEEANRGRPEKPLLSRFVAAVRRLLDRGNDAKGS